MREEERQEAEAEREADQEIVTLVREAKALGATWKTAFRTLVAKRLEERAAGNDPRDKEEHDLRWAREVYATAVQAHQREQSAATHATA